MEKRIIYDNRSFILGTAKRYYFATVKGKSVSLHRYKYLKEKGEIPKGWNIHHADKNCFNNDISNLVAIEPKKHSKLHPTLPETLDKWQKAGIKAATVWHSSKEGIEWHNRHYEKIKNKLHERIERECSFCRKKIEAPKKKGNCFCSGSCKSAWRRKNKPDMKMVNCKKCGKKFETLKYLPKTYCSLKCKPAPNPLGYHARKILIAK